MKNEHPELTVIPPFFWDESGRATIHGIITTSLKLTGESIMMSMMTDPGLVHSIHQWITDVYVILVNHFASAGDLKVTSVHVGECSGTMISSDQFEEYVVPYMSMLGDRRGPVRLHSCGMSDHIIGAASGIRNLKILDVGSGTSIQKIRDIMGRGFEINVFPPMELLMKGTPVPEVRTWLDKVLAENQDGPLKIAYHLEPDYDIRNVLIIHEELERRGLVKNERLY